MSTHEQTRRAHRIVDALKDSRILSSSDADFLRSFLPEPPKQKKLEEIIAHVYDAWLAASDYEFNGNEYDPDVTIEDWLLELHKQLKGLKDTSASVPFRLAPPEFLETEANYQNAPAGTVAAKDGWLAWIKQGNGDWSCDGGSEEGSILAQTGKRRVLRWGWTNE